MATKAKKKNAKPAVKAKIPAKKITKAAVKTPVKKAAKAPIKKAAKAPLKKATKPMAKKVVKPSKPVIKKSVAKVVAKAKPKVVKAVIKKVAKPVAKKAAKPIAKKIVTPIAKKATNQVVVAAKPVAPKAMPVPTVKSRPRRRRPIKVEVAPKPKEVKLTSANAAMISPPMLVIKQQPAPALAKQQFNADGSEKKRYSDLELKEFKDLITKKLESAKEEYQLLQDQLNHANEHGTDDTAGTFKMLEDGSDTLAKEEAGQLAARQRKFIEQLENALIRVENKSYGICRVTGKLIPKERLRAVPHTTQSMEAKLNQYKEN